MGVNRRDFFKIGSGAAAAGFLGGRETTRRGLSTALERSNLLLCRRRKRRAELGENTVCHYERLLGRTAKCGRDHHAENERGARSSWMAIQKKQGGSVEYSLRSTPDNVSSRSDEMEILSSRFMLHPRDFDRSSKF
jgi:hypothetical protein